MLVIVRLVLEVIATQSSWFMTTVFDKKRLSLEEKSNPSEL